MKKLSRYYRNKIKQNLTALFNQATPEDINEGVSWYPTAHAEAKRLSDLYDVTPLTAASVISALSPQNKWYRNLIDSEAVLKAVQNEQGPEHIKVCTFSSNKFKAFEIAYGRLEITPDSMKTYSFVKNIAHLDQSYVTVDRWHLRACFQKDIRAVSPTNYLIISDITKALARELGFKPFELQAILWIVCQKTF